MRDEELYSAGIFTSELDEDTGDAEPEFPGHDLDDDDLDEDDELGSDGDSGGSELDGFKSDEWN